MKLKNAFLLISSFLICAAGFAQSGSVTGIISNNKDNNPIPFANIIIKQADKVILGTISDFDGKYELTPIDSGNYSLEVSFVGYQTEKIKDITVHDPIELNIEIKEAMNICWFPCYWYFPNLYSPFDHTVEKVYQREEIIRLANF